MNSAILKECGSCGALLNVVWKCCACCGTALNALLKEEPSSPVMATESRSTGSQVYWETCGTGEILGPATVMDTLILQDAGKEEAWYWIAFEKDHYWIRDFCLRTREQWKGQKPVKTSERKAAECKS
jgi:hypothetical protein